MAVQRPPAEILHIYHYWEVDCPLCGRKGANGLVPAQWAKEVEQVETHPETTLIKKIRAWSGDPTWMPKDRNDR